MVNFDFTSIIDGLYEAEKYSKMSPIFEKQNLYENKIKFNDKLENELDDLKTHVLDKDTLELSITQEMSEDEVDSVVDKIKEQFNDIVHEFNDVVTFDMENNYSNNRIKRQMLDELLPLYKLGVKTDWKTGEVIVDNTKLVEFIKNHKDEFSDVVGVFTDNIKTKMEKAIENLEKENENYEKELYKLDDKKERAKISLSRYDDNLVKQFANLESYISVRMNNMSAMYNLIGGYYDN